MIYRNHQLIVYLFLLLSLGFITSCEEDPPPPVIMSVTPAFGSPETLITFEGMHLGNLTSLMFNDRVVNFNNAYNSDNALLFRIPTDMEIGEYVLTFSTAGGADQVDFRVTREAPQIFSFASESGQVGEPFTIYGENFYEPLEVYFTDSVRAEILTSSTDSIVVAVPEQAEQGLITVVANGGVTRSPVRFFQVNEILVNDFDGNGVRSATNFWAFSSGLDYNANTAIQNSSPSPTEDNFLKLAGKDDLGIGFIGAATTHSFDTDVFTNFGITTDLANTLLELEVNTNGHPATRLILVLRERDGSANDFSREIILDRSGWQTISQPLSRFQDIDGNLIDPTKVATIRLILFDTEATGSQFEANIDNLRFIEIL
ncbi:MAG: glycan-binding surface protein [Bacteroidota bacterium]